MIASVTHSAPEASWAVGVSLPQWLHGAPPECVRWAGRTVDLDHRARPMPFARWIDRAPGLDGPAAWPAAQSSAHAITGARCWVWLSAPGSAIGQAVPGLAPSSGGSQVIFGAKSLQSLNQ